MKRSLLVCILVLLSLSSCRLPQIGSSKKIVEHTPPELAVDNSYFAGLGCFESPGCLPAELQQLDPPIGYIMRPPDLLGALNPALPLARASTVLHYGEGEIEAVYVNQCLSDQYIRYLVRVGDEIQLIDTVDGMAALFAPIESPDEALSYAIATTGLSALYDIEKIAKIKLYTTPVEETFVQEVDNGYLVHLFHTYMCGCGPHIIRSVDVTLNTDGAVSTAEPVDAFSDPQYDGLCVD